MEFKIRDGEEYIKLGQLLKACDLVLSGAEAKIVINEGSVKVNGSVCTMRGRKISHNDTVIYNEKEVRVI